jgi:hypothetical protein
MGQYAKYKVSTLFLNPSLLVENNCSVAATEAEQIYEIVPH